MKLVGSKTSPFVRRIRLQLADRPYEFETIDVFSTEGQRRLKEFTPTARIPVLIDGGTIIWDSLLIALHLSDYGIPLHILKQLVLINELSDAGIQLFQLRKFGTDPNDDGQFSKNNLRRIAQILDHFENKNLKEWNTMTQWLFCTLDWFEFRKVHHWQNNHPQLTLFHQDSLQRPFVSATDPR